MSNDFCVIPNGIDLEIHCIDFSAVDSMQIDDFVSVGTAFKMLEYSTFLVAPAVLFGSDEQCSFRFTNIGFAATRAGKSVH